MVKAALSSGLKPILCVGETKEDFALGLNIEICTMQLSKALRGISSDDLKNIVIAYEPVWAIGTGLNASPKMAQEVHASIRNWIRIRYGPEVSGTIRILYGGSVTADNVDAIMNRPDIDGCLVGGASLNSETFAKIALPKKMRVLTKSILNAYDILGSSSKNVVSITAAVILLLSKTPAPLYYIVGSILNAMLSKILKVIFKQPRPPPNLSADYGMPSSHSQVLFYFLSVILMKKGFGGTLPIILTAYTLAATTWRVYVRQHSLPQVLAGAVIGGFMGFLVKEIEAVYMIKTFPNMLSFLNDISLSLRLFVLSIGILILYQKELKKVFQK